MSNVYRTDKREWKDKIRYIYMYTQQKKKSRRGILKVKWMRNGISSSFSCIFFCYICYVNRWWNKYSTKWKEREINEWENWEPTMMRRFFIFHEENNWRFFFFVSHFSFLSFYLMNDLDLLRKFKWNLRFKMTVESINGK